MENKITLTHEELMNVLAKTAGDIINKTNQNTNTVDENYVSPFAAWLLTKAGKAIVRPNGVMLSKSEVDETTLDFTMGRTLTEQDAEATVKFIYDKSPYLALFNSRSVRELVTPVKGRSITKKNLVSNEQNGGAVANVNRRIVHNFGINLYLKNISMQKDIPLQTVIDNLYNPILNQRQWLMLRLLWLMTFCCLPQMVWNMPAMQAPRTSMTSTRALCAFFNWLMARIQIHMET